jgi:hypothetical protein
MRSHPAMDAADMIIFAMIFVVSLIISPLSAPEDRAGRSGSYLSIYEARRERHQPVTDFSKAAGGLLTSPVPFVGSVLNFTAYQGLRA